MNLLSSRRRRRIARLWRARRGRAAVAAAAPPAPDATPRVRARHRAPTPDLGAPVAALLGNPSRVAALGASIVLSAMLVHLFTGPRFRVHAATVTGNQRLKAAAIFAQSGIDGRLVLAIDEAAVIARLKALADIRAAELELALPNRVTIRVVETMPVLLWQAPDGSVAIDDGGRAIPLPADPAVVAALLPVTDGTGPVPAVGAQLGAATVAAAQAYAARFGALTWRGAAEGFAASTADGWTVVLGADASQAALQAATLAALQRGVDAAADAIRLVDLRFPTRPYYRLRSGL